MTHIFFFHFLLSLLVDQSCDNEIGDFWLKFCFFGQCGFSFLTHKFLKVTKHVLVRPMRGFRGWESDPFHGRQLRSRYPWKMKRSIFPGISHWKTAQINDPLGFGIARKTWIATLTVPRPIGLLITGSTRFQSWMVNVLDHFAVPGSLWPSNPRTKRWRRFDGRRRLSSCSRKSAATWAFLSEFPWWRWRKLENSSSVFALKPARESERSIRRKKWV